MTLFRLSKVSLPTPHRRNIPFPFWSKTSYSCRDGGDRFTRNFFLAAWPEESNPGQLREYWRANLPTDRPDQHTGLILALPFIFTCSSTPLERTEEDITYPWYRIVVQCKLGLVARHIVHENFSNPLLLWSYCYTPSTASSNVHCCVVFHLK